MKQIFTPFTSALAIQILLLVGIIVFVNSLFNGFVGDDLGQIISNPTVHSLKNILTFFTGNIGSGSQLSLIGTYYRPVVLSYYSIIYSLFADSAFAFHFFQLPIHILNSLLLFLFLKKFFKNPIAFALSLIFLVHPINSEITYYISAVQEGLFFFFGILALLIVANYKSHKAFLAASACLLLSLFSKETGVLFVFACCLYLYLFSRKLFFPMMLYSIATVIVFALLRIHSIGLFLKLTSVPIANLPFSSRIISIPSIILFYLKTFFFPAHLAMIYQWTIGSYDISHFFIPLLFDILFFGSLLSFWVLLSKKSNKLLPKYLFFCALFLAGLALHLQIIPLDATVAERWFYFPMIGLLGLLGVVFEKVRVFKHLKTAVVLLIITTLLLSVRTILRGFDWRDEMTVASNDIKVSKNAYSLESELSYSYFKIGKYNEAKAHAQKSIDIYPAIINYYNLGAADFKLKDYKGSQEAFSNSLRYGNYAPSFENLAYISLFYGDHNQAIYYIKNTSLKKYPNDDKLWMYLAILEYNYGNKNNARYDITSAVSINPNSQQSSGVYNAISHNQQVTIDEGK